MNWNLKLAIITLVLIGCTSGPKKPNSLEQSLLFDHTFKVVEDTKFYFSLEDRGFTLMKKPVPHPGIESRFIGFTEMGYPVKQYLEWAHSKNFSEHKVKFKDRQDVLKERTGMGFIVNSNIEKQVERIKTQFPEYQPNFFHRNFSWQKESKERLPGWNFVQFHKPLVDDMSFFGFNYELSKKRNPKKVSHKNTAEGIIGVVIDGTPEEMARIGEYSQDTVEKGVISNGSNFHILSFEKLKDKKDLLAQINGKYKAVILKVGSLKKYKEVAKPNYTFEFYGQTFHGIKSPDGSWDILATDSLEFIAKVKSAP